MIYLDSSSGQLCNRLFNISSFISNAINYELNLIVFGFDEYHEYFDFAYLKMNHNKIIILNQSIFNLKITRKIFFFILKKCNQIPFQNIFYFNSAGGDLNTYEIKKSTFTKECLFQGWPYWNVELFKQHSNEIRKIFTPKIQYVDKANSFILSHKNSCDIVIGVHIRRGDYIDFYNGQYYFDNDYYLKYIELLNSMFVSKGNKPLFIICSNQSDEFHIDNISYVVSNNNAIVDLLILSKCHYIIGPPSTFSMWASFFGEVPLYWLGLNNNFNLSLFSPIVAPNTFLNGVNITL